MKFKVLKDFVSSIGNFFEGKQHDLELDEPTATMWTDHGLIEEVKEDQAPEDVPPQDVSPEVTAPTDNPAPADVTADENQ